MKILYVSRSKLSHSVNAIYIRGLRANNIDVRELFVGRKEHLDLIKFLFRNRNSFDAVVVGYDSPILVCLARVFSNKKVIYNALCSVYERLIVSRGLAPKYSLRSAYYWLLDFFAVHCADLVMVETNEQAEYFSRIFFLSQKKTFRAWTGADDRFFYDEPNTEKLPQFTVIFRGQFLPESGVEYAVKAAKILEGSGINFIIHGGGHNVGKITKLIEEINPKNLKLMTDFFRQDELKKMMRSCHLSLGQLGNHPRLIRTIPHKAYESLAMGLPYLTAANKGILELLKDGETCVVCNPADPNSLAEKILWAKNNWQELERIAERGHNLFIDKLAPQILAAELLESIKSL